jgi:hypothetical protein
MYTLTTFKSRYRHGWKFLVCTLISTWCWHTFKSVPAWWIWMLSHSDFNLHFPDLSVRLNMFCYMCVLLFLWSPFTIKLSFKNFNHNILNTLLIHDSSLAVIYLSLPLWSLFETDLAFPLWVWKYGLCM